MYCVIEESTIAELEKRVMASMTIGWVPQGGVTFSEGVYIQAMIAPPLPTEL